MNKQELQFLLEKYNITPRRQQGQNFLLDDQVIADTITAAALTKEDIVLEVGPGLGFLTSALADVAKQVVAVEQDRDLFPAIQKLSKAAPNITPYNADIRTFHLEQAELHDRQYKLVANLPYSITSWVLRQFLEYAPKPSEMIVMVQKEVAERVVAAPGQMSILACAVQLFGEPSIVRTVGRDSFYPVPKVESAILKVVMRETPQSPDPKALMKLIKVGFSAKRKQLHNTIQVGCKLTSDEAKAAIERAGLSVEIRPQELSLEQWESLRMALGA